MQNHEQITKGVLVDGFLCIKSCRMDVSRDTITSLLKDVDCSRALDYQEVYNLSQVGYCSATMSSNQVQIDDIFRIIPYLISRGSIVSMSTMS